MNDFDSWPEGVKPTAPILLQQLERLKSLDYFAVLGVSPGATIEVIRPAFFRHMKRWHPSKYALEDEGVRLAVAEIFILLRRAFDTISDPARSAAYRARLPAPTARAIPTATPATPPHAPPPRPGSVTTSKPLPSPPEAANSGSPISKPTPTMRPPSGASTTRTVMSPARPNPALGQPVNVSGAHQAGRSVDVRPPAAPSKLLVSTTTTRIAPRSTSTTESQRQDASGGTKAKAPAHPLAGTTAHRGAIPTKAAEPAPAVVEPFSEVREIARANNCLVDYNFKQARIHLERILVIIPTHLRAKALKHVADGLEAQISGRIDLAKKYYLESLSIDPTCGEATTGLEELAKQRTSDTEEKKGKAGLFRKLFFNE